MSKPGRCCICKNISTHIEYHHVLPKRHGGDERDEVPLCSQCHKEMEVSIAEVEGGHGKGYESKLENPGYYQLKRNQEEKVESSDPKLEKIKRAKYELQGGRRSQKSWNKAKQWK